MYRYIRIYEMFVTTGLQCTCAGRQITGSGQHFEYEGVTSTAEYCEQKSQKLLLCSFSLCLCHC